MTEPSGRSRALSPYLTVKDAAAAIDFYRAAFGAVEQFRLTGPDGRIGHAELRIGGRDRDAVGRMAGLRRAEPALDRRLARSSCTSMSTTATRWWPARSRPAPR